MVLKTICIWKFTPYIKLSLQLNCSYIVLILVTQMYITIRLCEVFLLYNSMFIKPLPSHKAECQLGSYSEKWISESFRISSVNKVCIR